MDTQVSTPRGSITIRQAQESDAVAYRVLRLEALRNHPEAFSADYARNEGQPIMYWVDRLSALGDDGMFYFAFYEPDQVGICGIYRGYSPKTKHSATIINIYVQADWRGFGITEGLIEGCPDWARADKVSLVKLAVGYKRLTGVRTGWSFEGRGIQTQPMRKILKCFNG